ncbi:hypothetical protein HDU76_009477 [Blyttiomyces sp. JEL0837]|nr:hypothetical protein HDU76_009477 [Blyttiomyces sp. JEL0837]
MNPGEPCTEAGVSCWPTAEDRGRAEGGGEGGCSPDALPRDGTGVVGPSIPATQEVVPGEAPMEVDQEEFLQNEMEIVSEDTMQEVLSDIAGVEEQVDVVPQKGKEVAEEQKQMEVQEELTKRQFIWEGWTGVGVEEDRGQGEGEVGGGEEEQMGGENEDLVESNVVGMPGGQELCVTKGIESDEMVIESGEIVIESGEIVIESDDSGQGRKVVETEAEYIERKRNACDKTNFIDNEDLKTETARDAHQVASEQHDEPVLASGGDITGEDAHQVASEQVDELVLASGRDNAIAPTFKKVFENCLSFEDIKYNYTGFGDSEHEAWQNSPCQYVYDQSSKRIKLFDCFEYFTHGIHRNEKAKVKPVPTSRNLKPEHKLKPFQEQGVAALLQKEHRHPPTSNKPRQHWIKVPTANGRELYENIIDGQWLGWAVCQGCPAWLCSQIKWVSEKQYKSMCVFNVDCEIIDLITGGNDGNGGHLQPAVPNPVRSDPVYSDATLIIVPNNLCPLWEAQFKAFTKDSWKDSNNSAF